jgi:hypothetical protein
MIYQSRILTTWLQLGSWGNASKLAIDWRECARPQTTPRFSTRCQQIPLLKRLVQQFRYVDYGRTL